MVRVVGMMCVAAAMVSAVQCLDHPVASAASPPGLAPLDLQRSAPTASSALAADTLAAWMASRDAPADGTGVDPARLQAHPGVRLIGVLPGSASLWPGDQGPSPRARSARQLWTYRRPSGDANLLVSAREWNRIGGIR